MDLFRDPSSGADNSAGGQAQQPPASIHNGPELPNANHTNPVQVMPCQIQMVAKFDDQGRRYMVLKNLPRDKNYVANWINNGAEFAIGGTPEFISNALNNELAARVTQDTRNQCTQSWHVVVIPDSNMSNAPISQLYRGSEPTERYPLATTLRPTQQSHQNNQQAMVFKQNTYNGQQALIPQRNFHGSQQPVLTQNNSMDGYGRGDSSVAPSQQSQFTTPTPGTFNNGGGPTMMFPQEQLYSQPPQQGSFQRFNQSSELPMEPLPQIHRPIFDKYGNIIGEEGSRNGGNMYGGNLYNDIMYRSSMYSSNTVRNPQLAAAAQSFYSFVKNKMDQDEEYQDEGDRVDDDQNDGDFEEMENQDEGITLGNTSSNNANSPDSQEAALDQSESPPMELLLASEKEPHRFADNTGMGLCDYCGRSGHEADACIKWDPFHFDKPVCTACNNDQHSLDECAKFRAMPTPEKQVLLLDKGAHRPGVRSDYNAWTSYVRRGGYVNGGGGLPLTRRFLFNLSVDHDSGAILENIWKVWDYERGVPDQFRDPRAEALSGNLEAPVDERFMGGYPSMAQNQSQRQSQPQSRAGNGNEDEGDETEL